MSENQDVKPTAQMVEKDEKENFLLPSSTEEISTGDISNRMNYEEALKLCGGFGRFQAFITFVFPMGLFTDD